MQPSSDMNLDLEAGTAARSLAHKQRQGLTITFKDLTYTVGSNVDKGQKITLLSHVSGYFQPYQMTALMGPSGSGKTTLLDILAGRKTVGSISGDIRFGGMTPSPAFLRRYTGYVEQFDTLIGSLTVEEMLLYTAELKRPRSEPYSSKASAVSGLLEELGLTRCKDVQIGDPLSKGISGGQAKRTNIGIALISNPRVLFLDEPTSGLDSFSADEVVGLVRGLAQAGVTVVATIHSPSSHAFALFDRVLLLARGSTCYFGPQGDAPLLFAQQYWPASKSQAGDASMAELLMGMITEADRAGNSQLLADAYASSPLRKENDGQLELLVSSAGKAPTRASSSKGLVCRAASKLTGKQCNVSVTASSAKPAAGDSTSSILPESSSQAADLQATASAAVTLPGAMPQPEGDSPLAGTPSSQDATVVLAALPTAPSMMDAELASKLNTRNSTSTPWWWALWVLLKYRASVNYKNPAWFMPRIMDKFLFAFIILTLYLKVGDQFDDSNLINLSASLFMWTTLPAYGAVAYVPSIVLERPLFLRERADGLYHVGTYMAAKLIEELSLATIISIIFSSFVFYGVQFQGSFVLFWLVYLLVLSNGIALGYLMAAISPNLDVANAALPAYVTTLLFFAGQLATYDSIPAYWRWYSRIDFIRYAWTALMANQFQDNNPPFGGSTVLDYYGVGGQSAWANFSYLFAFFAVFSTLGYLALSYVKHAKR